MKTLISWFLASVFLIIAGTACKPQTTQISGVTEDEQGGGGGRDIPTPTPDISLFNIGTGTIGVKNLSQIAPSMTAVTKVDPDTTMSSTMATYDLRSLNQDILPWMSADGSSLSVNSAMLLSMAGFAGAVCHAFISNEIAISGPNVTARMAHANINFSLDASTITQAQVNQVVTNYYRLFLSRDPNAVELSILWEAVTDAKTALVGTPSSMHWAFMVPCTAILASPDFIKG